jgi:hypothetical protein
MDDFSGSRIVCRQPPEDQTNENRIRCVGTEKQPLKREAKGEATETFLDATPITPSRLHAG